MLFVRRERRSVGKIKFLFALVLVFLFNGCGTRVAENEIVARVGDAVLTREVMKERMVWEGMRSEYESEFVERWVDRELLYQEARRMGLHKTVELHWELDLVEREYLIHKLLERTFVKKLKITEEEIRLYYEKNKELFRVDQDEVRAFHLLVKTREEANLALQEIRAGKPFEEVVKEHSVGILKEQGGDMGFFRKGDVISEIARVAFYLSEGKVSAIFQSSHGYHILKVLKKRRKDDVKDLSEVRDEISQRLRVNKERAVYYDLLYQLQNKTKVYVSIPRNKEKESDTLAVQTLQR